MPTPDTPLTERAVAPDPFRQFAAWFADAEAADEPLPHAMALATVGVDQRPSSRMVLLKGADERGFAFYTNYRSRKAEELAANPHAALLFHWPRLHRQVRITGTVTKVSAAESDGYFATRPRGAQLSAWASPQSVVIADRDALEGWFAARAEEFAGAPNVPRPPHWGGYRVSPDAVEFWQGRDDRLHDRLRYTRVDDGWRLERLAP